MGAGLNGHVCHGRQRTDHRDFRGDVSGNIRLLLRFLVGQLLQSVSGLIGGVLLQRAGAYRILGADLCVQVIGHGERDFQAVFILRHTDRLKECCRQILLVLSALLVRHCSSVDAHQRINSLLKRLGLGNERRRWRLELGLCRIPHAALLCLLVARCAPCHFGAGLAQRHHGFKHGIGNIRLSSCRQFAKVFPKPLANRFQAKRCAASRRPFAERIGRSKGRLLCRTHRRRDFRRLACSQNCRLVSHIDASLGQCVACC